MHLLSICYLNKRSRTLLLAILLALGLAILLTSIVYAISPEYLKNGRTYDQERTYIQWNGSVSNVTIYHKDNTSLPSSEGGGSCANGCTETVTRIQNGSSISGNFTFLSTFSIQAAMTGDRNVGTVVVRACGQVIASQNLYASGAGSPGFNNYPSPAWSVPTSGDCTWSITASGGYVDIRAVTTSYRSASAPTVDLRINNTNGPANLSAPGNLTLSWTTSNAAACTASGNWAGSKATNGSEAISNLAAGTYAYTLTCTNPSGSASDTVTANVYGAPVVDVRVNNQNGPLTFTEPAAYTVSWSSSNATTCQAEGNLTGAIGASGSRAYNNVLQGTYTYTVRCSNPIGAQAVDSVQVQVNPQPPVVDLKIDGKDAPTTYTSPASYTLSWSSQYATTCRASSSAGDWAGNIATAGNKPLSNVPSGVRSYTLTCTNISGSRSDTVSVVILAPLNGTISPLYSKLILLGPGLGQPAQTLMGTVTGGEPPYIVQVSIRSPFGGLQTYRLNGANWSLAPAAAGEPNLGVTEKGTWTAWVDLQDAGGRTYRTGSVTWEVSWYPVHGRP
jgi:hypothetical protein